MLNEFVTKSKKESTEWLKARTAYIMGIPPNDRKAKLLTTSLNTFLGNFNGKVLSEKLTPEYQSLIEIEQNKKELEFQNILVSKS